MQVARKVPNHNFLKNKLVTIIFIPSSRVHMILKKKKKHHIHRFFKGPYDSQPHFITNREL